jgi:hypothetical protein
MSQISEFRILSVTDFETLLGVSTSRAKQLRNDVRQHFKLEKKPILFIHFKRYFNA